MCRFKLQIIVLLAVAMSLFCVDGALGQVTLDPTWPVNPRTFGGEEAEVATSVQRTLDGGYIVAGWTLGGAAGGDVYLIKLDSNGKLDPAWNPNPKTFGGVSSDGANSVQQTLDGGYIVAGYTYSFGAGGVDVYVIKLDAQGDLDSTWDTNPRTFGGEGRDDANCVQQTADGGFVIAGLTTSFGAGNKDVYLIKLDSNGNLDPAWNPNPKTFGGTSADSANSVQQTANGGYVVAGVTASFGAGAQDAYLIRLDSAGNLDPTWEPNPKTFGGDQDDGATSVQETFDGGYIAAGEAGSFGGWCSDAYVIKLDAQGNLDPAWDPNEKTFGSFLTCEVAKCIRQTQDGGYIVAGSTFLDAPTVYLVKLDVLGNLCPSWDPNPRTFGYERSWSANSMQLTPDGGFIVAGQGGGNVLLLKLAPARNFLRGDCNADGRAEGIPDAVSLLSYSFRGGTEPPCIAACDADGDGDIGGTTDALYILRYFFMGSQEPPASPFPECGAGQLWTDGPLTCETELPCP